MKCIKYPEDVVEVKYSDLVVGDVFELGPRVTNPNLEFCKPKIYMVTDRFAVQLSTGKMREIKGDAPVIILNAVLNWAYKKD